MHSYLQVEIHLDFASSTVHLFGAAPYNVFHQSPPRSHHQFALHLRFTSSLPILMIEPAQTATTPPGGAGVPSTRHGNIPLLIHLPRPRAGPPCISGRTAFPSQSACFGECRNLDQWRPKQVPRPLTLFRFFAQVCFCYPSTTSSIALLHMLRSQRTPRRQQERKDLRRIGAWG